MDIQSQTQSLEDIFNGIYTRYAVPHYQRDYSWSHDHRLELWNDIYSAFERDTKYFLGSFVLNTENRAATGVLDIVDGQQRLATLTTLFAVIRDICRAYYDDPNHEAFSAVNSSDKNRQAADDARYYSRGLIVRGMGENNFFLELNSKDQNEFRSNVQTAGEALLNHNEQQSYSSEHRLKKAKKFFSRKIVDVFLSKPEGFVELNNFLIFCATKLLLLRISVVSDSDAYLLFETLNDRGMDLSIADLVKNRLLLRCQGNEIEKAQLLEKWNELIKILQKSRFQTHDFLRFYWCAFHENCTKKELYRKMREEIDGGDGRQIVGMWIDSAEFFSQITNIDLKFPRSSLDHNSLESTYAELNTLGYSVYLPLFLKLNRDRDSLLQQIAPVCLNYLMRIITVGKFSAGRAEGRFNKAIEMVNSEVDVKDIIACFGNDPESINDKFIERLKTQRFENNNSAKYILSKIHLHDVGSGHPLNSSVHLEHVLPQSRTSWPDFDTQSRAGEDWVYSLGNMTLLEDKINNALQARLFSEKVKRFERRTNRAQTGQTAIPMSYEIHDTYKENSRDWDGDWIQKRANNFARKAVKVWPLDVTIDPPLQEMEAGSDIDNSEQI